MAQIQPITYSQLVEFNALEAREQPAILYDIAGGHNKMFFLFETYARSLGRTWRPKYKRIFDIYQQDNVWPSSPVLNATVSGGTVVLTLPANVDGRMFVRNNIVDNGIVHDLSTNGHVVASTQSTVTIAPIPGQSTIASLMAAYTAPGAIVRVASRSDELKGSGNADNWHIAPKKWQNMCMIIREGLQLNNDDARMTIFMRSPNIHEGYMLVQGPVVLRRLLSYIEHEMLWGAFNSNYVVQNSTYGRSHGIYNSIVDQGGPVLQLTSALTQSAFEGFITDLASRRADFNGTFLAVVGRQLMGTIASFYQTQIQQGAPTTTTLDGEQVTLRLNVDRLRLPNGITVDFLVSPLLSDKKRNPKITTVPGMSGLISENTAFILDMDEINDAITGERLPAFELVSFDDKPFYFGAVRGIRDGAAVTSADQVKVSFGVADVNTVVDKREYSILFDGGWVFHRGWSSGIIIPKF